MLKHISKERGENEGWSQFVNTVLVLNVPLW